MRKPKRSRSAPGPERPPDRLLRWWPEQDYKGLSPWDAFQQWKAEQRAWADAPGRDGDLTEDVDVVMLFRWWHRVRHGLPLWDAAEVEELAARGKGPPF